jgi:hypothetical protein
MTNNASLTLRCPDKGHKLAEVVYENGKPFAYCRESGTYVTNDPSRQGTPKTFTTRWDLLEEYPDSTQVIVACRCGRRMVSLADVLDRVQAGKTGKTLTHSQMF